jgi:hypothetical protein
MPSDNEYKFTCGGRVVSVAAARIALMWQPSAWLAVFVCPACTARHRLRIDRSMARMLIADGAVTALQRPTPLAATPGAEIGTWTHIGVSREPEPVDLEVIELGVGCPLHGTINAIQPDAVVRIEDRDGDGRPASQRLHLSCPGGRPSRRPHRLRIVITTQAATALVEHGVPVVDGTWQDDFVRGMAVVDNLAVLAERDGATS